MLHENEKLLHISSCNNIYSFAEQGFPLTEKAQTSAGSGK
jgi:hypothetical protein